MLIIDNDVEIDSDNNDDSVEGWIDGIEGNGEW